MESIPLGGNHRRYFDNPFIADSALAERVEHAITSTQICEWIEQLAARIINRRVPPEEFKDNCPYVGASGVAYALNSSAHKLENIHPPSTTKLSDWMKESAIALVESSRFHSKSHRQNTSYLTGSVGNKVVEAIVLSQQNHPEGKAAMAELTALYRQLASLGQMPQENEVLNGKAGMLLGLDTLKMDLEHLGSGRKELLSSAEHRAVLSTIIREGRDYAARHRSPAPLMWRWYGQEYLGAAHGVAGILQALLNSYDLLETDGDRQDVKATLDWYVSLQAGDGNFPAGTDEIGSHRHPELVHWCHGAPGVVPLLVAAALKFKSSSPTDYERYVGAAGKCADLIWARGVLRKGPGICHGVAGNGYAFLLLYRLTHDGEYLRRARLFAAIAMEPRFEVRVVPDSFLISGFTLIFCLWKKSRDNLDTLLSNLRGHPTLPTAYSKAGRGHFAS